MPSSESREVYKFSGSHGRMRAWFPTGNPLHHNKNSSVYNYVCVFCVHDVCTCFRPSCSCTSCSYFLPHKAACPSPQQYSPPPTSSTITATSPQPAAAAGKHKVRKMKHTFHDIPFHSVAFNGIPLRSTMLHYVVYGDVIFVWVCLCVRVSILVHEIHSDKCWRCRCNCTFSCTKKALMWTRIYTDMHRWFRTLSNVQPNAWWKQLSWSSSRSTFSEHQAIKH